MKKKTSITLSKDLLAKIDRLAGSKRFRSAFIERVLRRYLRERARGAVHARDLARINRAAERLNRDAGDVLKYQSARPPLIRSKRPGRVALDNARIHDVISFP